MRKPSTNPPERFFNDRLRKEALQRLHEGQPHDEVAQLLEVSISELICWEVQGVSTVEWSRSVAKLRAYPESVKIKALKWLQQGESISQVAKRIGASPMTISHWQKKAKSNALQ